MQRPRGMREKGAFGELQMVQPGWEFERGMKLEVMGWGGVSDVHVVSLGLEASP